jgi:hypothetical protein
MLRSVISTLPRAATRAAFQTAPITRKTMLPAVGSMMPKIVPAFGAKPAMRTYSTSVPSDFKRASVQSEYSNMELFENLNKRMLMTT